MSAYIFASVEITDPAAYEEYRRRVQAIIAAEPRPSWWQCSVLNEPFAHADYLKTDSKNARRNSHDAHGG
jgi:hypothetical protein